MSDIYYCWVLLWDVVNQVTCKFQVLLLNFVRQDRKTFRKKNNFSLLLKEQTSKNFICHPMNMTFSISAGRNRHYTLCCVSQKDRSLWEFWVVFPSNTAELYTCMSWSALSWISQRDSLQVSGILSVCVSFFYPVLWTLDYLTYLNF